MTIHRLRRLASPVVLAALLAAPAPTAAAAQQAKPVPDQQAEPVPDQQAEPVPDQQAEPFLLHLVPVPVASPAPPSGAQPDPGSGPKAVPAAPGPLARAGAERSEPPPAERRAAPTVAPGRVRVVAEALTALRGDAEPPPARTLEGVEVPGTVELDLVPGFVWRLSATGDRVWAPPEVLVLAEPGGEKTLRVWPTGTVRGRLVAAPAGTVPDDDLPAALRVRFETVPASVHRERGRAAPAESRPEVPRTHLDCPVGERGTFSCSLPAGPLDLRLQPSAADDFVPVYRWGVAVPPGGKTDLGAVALERGASLAGWVVVEDGALDPEAVTVTVAPQAAGTARSREEQERRARLARQAEVDERGFFQLVGLRPGAYAIAATQPGFAITRRAPVELEEMEETRLRDPLVLTPPLTLEVAIEPALDPEGTRWEVEVLSLGDSSIPAEGVQRRSAAAPVGSYELGGLSAGRYLVQVLGPDGSRLAGEELELDTATAPVQIVLDLVAVDGLLLLGDEPLAGRLVFGGENGAVRVPMEAGEDGSFGGLLPRAGRWPIEVTSEDPRVRRRLWRRIEAVDGRAEVEVRLPDTLISGRVVDEQGGAVSGAIIKLIELDQKTIPVAEWSGDDGGFAVHGLGEGLVHVDAQATGGRTSGGRAVDLEAQRVVEGLELVVREREAVEGRVLSPAGPVVGAEVMATVRRGGAEEPFALSPRGFTDVEGRFALQVPEGTDGLDLVVLAPGFALTVRRVEPLPEEPIQVAVEEYGGTLAVERYVPPGPPEERGPNSFAVVVYEGIVVGPGVLADWIRLAAEGSGWWQGDRTVVPRMPPGDYAVCRPDLAAVFRALALGEDVGPLLGTSCERGYLPPYGELELTAPEPPAGEEDPGRGR